MESSSEKVALSDIGNNDIEAIKDQKDSNDGHDAGNHAAKVNETDLFNESKFKTFVSIDRKDQPASTLKTEFDQVFEKGISQVQQKVNSYLQIQTTRLDECEQRLENAVQQSRAFVNRHEEVCRDLRRQVECLHIQLQRERDDRAEERTWITKLWPDNVPLPTLLITKAEIEFVKDLTDEQERRYYEALMTKRVERDRVRQYLEEALNWKVVFPQSFEENDTQLPYYTNTRTGVSVWDAPVAIDFQAPAGWNITTMDWKEDYRLENFYPEAQRRTKQPDGENSDEEKSETGRNEEKEDCDDGILLDPMPARERFEEEFKRYESLKMQLEQCAANQRTFAMEVLTATRELFAQEQETLKKEDDEVIAIERRRKIAEQEEQAAAKAKADAQERKVQQAKAIAPVYARITIAKKGLTSVVDMAVEQELLKFAQQRRLDRLYLSIPLTRDVRVRNRHQFEPEFVHMKHIESRVLESEHLESQLLEKSALRLDDAAAKAAAIQEYCHEIRKQQQSVEDEIARLEATLTLYKAPKQLQPSHLEFERASTRILSVDSLSDEDNCVDCNDDSKDFINNNVSTSPEGENSLPSGFVTASRSANISLDSSSFAGNDPDDTPLTRDEAELHALKASTDSVYAEKAERIRSSKLHELSDRRSFLGTSLKQLVSALARYEDDFEFFNRLRDSEKAANTQLWDLQAQTQVERARFLVERTAREESVLQVQDRLHELQQRLEDAYALPMQAHYPLERMRLEAQSEKLVALLTKQKSELEAKVAKEEKAKALLVSLELKSCDIVDARLREESILANEKQSLWELHVTLMNELQTSGDTLDLLVQQNETKEHSCSIDESVESFTKQQFEENVRVYETKRQYLKQVRRFLLMCYDREKRWRALAACSLMKHTTSDDWMTKQQLSRHEEALSLIRTQHEEQEQHLQLQIDALNQAKVTLQTQVDDLNSRIFRLQSNYQAASESIRLQNLEVITAVQQETQKLKILLENEKRNYRLEREKLIRTHDVIREELEMRLQELENVNDRQTHWLTAVKRELQAQRAGNEQLLKAYTSLEKRRAAEVNDMHFRISSQIKRIHNLEMWNLALQRSAKDAAKDYSILQEDIERHQQRHIQLQRGLRLINWRHRVTAQSILTDVNLLFSFFSHGIEILAGATAESNDSLRENAGIEVLAALAQFSKREEIRAICAHALGQLSWNANATMRSVGWKAKTVWFQWLKSQSNAVLDKLSATDTSFDDVAEEESTHLNWLADPSAPTDDISGEIDHNLSSTGGRGKFKRLLFSSTWQHFDEKVSPDMNVANQQYIGLSSNILRTIFELCRSSEFDERVKCSALHSFALIARSSNNTSTLGQLDGSISLLVNLLQSSLDQHSPQLVRHAAQALANLSYQNAFNQQLIFAEGGIPLLLCLCERAVTSSNALADVDLTLACTQILSHLSHDHVPSCQMIVESRGIAILTKLCTSPQIHDAIDVEIDDWIQMYASQVIANTITLLDDERSESDHRSFSVADYILLEDKAIISGASNEIQTHEYDNQKKTRSRSNHAGVTTFVLMCASCNRNVAFHGAVVLGSIAQTDAIRGAIGAASGIDALFLLTARTDDLAIVVQATWALANLTWNRDNQYRIARYFDQLYKLCTLQVDSKSKFLEDAIANEEVDKFVLQIRQHALCILANSLFYNEANRRLVASRTDWMQFLGRTLFQDDRILLENSTRALCSLSYSDAIALQMGSPIFEDPFDVNSVNGLEVFIRICGSENIAAQQHALFGVINMCLHDVNKTKMLQVPHGIDTLVTLSGHTNKELCDLALEALDLLADIRQYREDQTKSSNQSLESVDLEKLIVLLSDTTNPSLVPLLSDTIADKVWTNSSAQIQLQNEHSLEKLLEICTRLSPLVPTAASEILPADAEHQVRISCLWALRNTVANNVRNQDFVGALSGVQHLVGVFNQIHQSEEVVEALLAALVSLVTGHAKNSQQLVRFGLDMLIDLAEDNESERRNQNRGTLLPALMSPVPVKESIGLIQKPVEKQLKNAALARELLHLIATYNTQKVVKKALVLSNSKARKRQESQSSSTLKSPVHTRSKMAS
ncbi:Armadillo-type fold [Plasmopara halstedii]|uniref:Armadillo-type fold n=1 Tax=Plasmopara halstedii TaxID=4781 RepID=A0A0P1AUF9_PLAHL|nr:Armadillo-type fold [Plasmopara halstedii]CEG45921.1 Armadillo-type fold [Plasmopara halstedii]|eukprot:XP_024582290.1 Armadillo-type fold [Plasmopara halstedii]